MVNELRVRIPPADRRTDEDQRQAAGSRTTQVPGVADVENAITLTRTPDAREAGGVISAAFRRNAVLDAAVLSVQTSSDGLVILWGTVSSWAAPGHASEIAAPVARERLAGLWRWR